MKVGMIGDHIDFYYVAAKPKENWNVRAYGKFSPGWHPATKFLHRFVKERADELRTVRRILGLDTLRIDFLIPDKEPVHTECCIKFGIEPLAISSQEAASAFLNPHYIPKRWINFDTIFAALGRTGG